MSPEDGENPARGAPEQTSASARCGAMSVEQRPGLALARRLAGEGGPPKDGARRGRRAW